jgi:hypothetical protein
VHDKPEEYVAAWRELIAATPDPRALLDRWRTERDQRDAIEVPITQRLELLKQIAPEAEHLTTVDPAFDRRRYATYAGQASWATEAGTTCRECIFWTGCGRENGRYAGKRGSEFLKPRACEKYCNLMNDKIGAAVPHDAPSCRFFLPNPNPPAIYA